VCLLNRLPMLSLRVTIPESFLASEDVGRQKQSKELNPSICFTTSTFLVVKLIPAGDNLYMLKIAKSV
jgi:hypothetical protein